MLGDLLETIGSLGLLASALIHYRMAFSGRSEALPEDPSAAHDRASDH
ncbi:hypothetical protein [Caballeronia sp. LZ034LL]|nr:hypothetical protein [Caballeronia sp. LZ034LL]MDR5835894.1 hypothetical protein [Caballeronia sp. LZ034LL]